MKIKNIIIALVILVLIIIASFIPMKVTDRIPAGKAKIMRTKMLIRALNLGIDQYKLDTGNYPSEEHGLNHLIEQYDVKTWNGPYWEKNIILPDGWNNSFDYKLINNIPIVISSGADGKFGTYDDIETGIR